MKVVQQVFIYLSITFTLVLSQTKEDEGRPYEFGFTIDGQQHRHEKKDDNGIIQGEFGFITADGIYHVTAYATDENGDFKILSMRNVRISAPLDGSPGPGGPLSAQPVAAQPGPSPLGPGQLKPISQPTPSGPPQPPPQNVIQTTTRPFKFTTQPTIKPACGGCGYVTTPKPKPGDRFPFQTPGFAKPQNELSPPGGDFGPASPEQPFNNGIVNNPGSFGNNPGPVQQTFGGNPLNNPGPEPGNNPFGNNPGSLGSFNPGNPGSFNPGNPTSFNPGNPGSFNPGHADDFSNPGHGFDNNPGQPLDNPQSNPVSVLPPIQVTDNRINIQSNPPMSIDIKDKFPGMQPGLPEGVTEGDLKNILYKFKYEVGFHGHYEMGLSNGAKIGGYFVNGRDGVSRIVTYIADENGYRPKFKFVRLGLDETPNEATEKRFGLKSFEFVWYPIK